jgi:sugar phosphate permease
LIDVTQRGTGLVGGIMNGSNYLGSSVATALFPLLVLRIGWTSGLQCASFAAFASGFIWLGINSSRQIDADSRAG